MLGTQAIHPQAVRFAERGAARAPLVNMLVVVDPTRRPNVVIEKAARIAHAYGSSIHLLSCVRSTDLPDAWAGGTTLAAYHGILRERQVSELERLAQPLRKSGLAVTSEALCTDRVADAILTLSITGKADLVVKDAGADGEPAEIDARLTRELAAPLLLVRPTPWPFHPRICVAVDPCHTADRPASLDDLMIGAGQSLAHALIGGLDLVHVLQSPPHLPGATVAAEARQAAHAHAQSCVRELARRAGLADDAIHFGPGHIPEAISTLAASAGADIVVLGAGARPRFQNTSGGSAAYLLETVGCDVLVLKPPGFVSPVLEE